MIRGIIFLLVAGLLSISCSKSPQYDQSLAQADTTHHETVLGVEIIPIKRKTFNLQVISNGKALAAQEIPLSFQISGTIEQITIRNSSIVKMGQRLASLENDSQKLALKEAQLALNESKVEIDDLIITQGGIKGDSCSVSKEVYSHIKLRSGYNRALLAVEKATLELSKTFLYAPVDGIAANLTITSHSPYLAGAPFCTLLHRDQMIVRCSILETELAAIHLGQTANVEIAGRPGLVYPAIVEDINPIVNRQGLIDVTVRLKNTDPTILSGMNVRVVLEKSFKNQLVVPKESVVDRNGRKVVFTFEKGLAKWHYVTTGQENDREILISEGLKEGALVITSGNLNLGHDAKVKLTNSGI